jgi:multiple sugar transport system substrate-binding protein
LIIKNNIKLVTSSCFITALLLTTVANAFAANLSSEAPQKKRVTLTGLFDNLGDPQRWYNFILKPAIQEMRVKHPDLDIQLDYRALPYQNVRSAFLQSIANKTNLDIMDIDPSWLGEFAQNGLLTDITNLAESWGHLDDMYQVFLPPATYNHRLYALYTIADIRAMWYWKDLLNQAGVDPSLLKTWSGYLSAAKKLNAVLRPLGIEGMHLVGASHAPDIEFYPYLWMLGGDILKQKNGYPAKGSYYYPAFNGTEGVRALSFIKSQIDAGIKPQKQHYWGKEFLERKFAVMLEALQNHVRDDYNVTTPEKAREFEQKVGMIPMFPIPDPSYQSATLLGGWELGIPQSSKNKDLAWELITTMLEPKIIGPMLQKYGLLPTRISLGEGPSSIALNSSIPYYAELVSMIKIGKTRPNIPEFPQISENIKQAIDQIYNGTREPKQALDEAAARSAKILGW